MLSLHQTTVSYLVLCILICCEEVSWKHRKHLITNCGLSTYVIRWGWALFVLWGLRFVVSTFLLSSERQSSKYGTKQLPTEFYTPEKEGRRREEGGK